MLSEMFRWLALRLVQGLSVKAMEHYDTEMLDFKCSVNDVNLDIYKAHFQ